MNEENTSTKELRGRLREHDRHQIAVDLIEWSLKDTSVNLCGFCAEKLIQPSKLTQWSNECDLFRQAFEIAKGVLGNRREVKLSLGTLHIKAYDLNAPTYDHFLKYDRRDEKIFDHDLQKKMIEFMHNLKKETLESVSEEVKNQFDSLMNQITKMQDKKK